MFYLFMVFNNWFYFPGAEQETTTAGASACHAAATPREDPRVGV